jgi:hypothetical protein
LSSFWLAQIQLRITNGLEKAGHAGKRNRRKLSRVL